MASRKKTFREKRDDSKGMPRVVPLSGGMQRRYGPGTILIPSPLEVDELMRRPKKGQLVTVNQMREHLAARHGATVACPIVTGIHARIAAGAAGEELEGGRKRVTPFWRTLKSDGALNEKYPGGLVGQRARLEAEGHEVVSKGKELVVADFEARLVKLQEEPRCGLTPPRSCDTRSRRS